MRSAIKFLLPTLAASVLLSACGSSSSSSSSGTTSSAANSTASAPASSAVAVKTASNSKIGGTILVNANGMTLYHLTGEGAGKFICTSSGCLGVWHPLTVASGAKPSGSVGSLGVVKRPNGVTQVTYNGEPLYTFAHDTAPGQASGQGFKDVGTWTVIMTHVAKKGSTPAAGTTTTSTGGGYQY